MNQPSISLFAFCDESGNTGLNIADAQRNFYQCTLISERDLDVTITELDLFRTRYGVARLHASELGLAAIETFIDDVGKILQETKSFYLVSVIDKIHLAKLKLFDLIFDSGTNKAVPALTYGLRALRLSLAQILIQNIDDDEILRFWTCFTQEDGVGLHQAVEELLDIFCSNRRCDTRSFELIYDAINYFLRNPDIFIGELGKHFNSPNIVGFSMQLGEINSLYHEKPHKITAVTHDLQDQFGKELTELYMSFKNMRSSQHMQSLISDVSMSDLFMPNFKIISSAASNGLQLVDVGLYLYRADPAKLQRFPNCSKFVAQFFPVKNISELTPHQLRYEVMTYQYLAQQKPFTKKDAKRGKALISKSERARWKSSEHLES